MAMNLVIHAIYNTNRSKINKIGWYSFISVVINPKNTNDH